MIKGLRPGPSAQYFARKPPQTLEKLLQKMDEYIRADNDFRQRREEAFRFSEMTRGFGGRFHPRHVRSIHNSSQSDDRGSQQQRPQYSSQASGQQQSSFRPPAPRGRGARGFGGRFGDQPRRIYCLFCGELLLLRQVNHKHLGNSLHRHHQRSEASSQKGVSTLTFNETSERSPKLAQSIALYQSRSIFTEDILPRQQSFSHFQIQYYFLINKEQL
jgi:hypothetical protein